MQRSHFLDLRPGNLLTQRRATEQNWSNFLSNIPSNISTRDFIQDSWHRCLRGGINPTRTQTEVILRENEIKDLIQRSHLYELSIRTLEEISEQAKWTSHLVTLCDNRGRILFVDGDHDALRLAERMNFVLGADWSEDAIGTNAIGTSLVLERPVQIFAAEHFCEGIHDWVCSSMPIRDPLSNEILGVLDVTGIWRRAQSHTLGMAIATAQNIQFRLLQHSTRVRHRLLEEYVAAARRYPRDGIMVLDASFGVVEANQLAAEILKTPNGTGLTSEWNNQEFHQLLLQSLLPQSRSGANESEMTDIVEERLGLHLSIRHVLEGNRRIGFLLGVKPLLRRRTDKHVPGKGSWATIIGESSCIRAAITKSDIVAQSDVPILLLGESGTGKERFARSIHEASPRHSNPFVAINCGAIPKELLASELFGYEPGTFTGAVKSGKKGKFEEAQGGTIFLDEIGEMPMEFQVYLLRVLQEHEIVRLGSSKPVQVDARVMAATNRSLEHQVQVGTFRSDLYYRLNVVGITLPPLRERREDIPLLIKSILDLLAQHHQGKRPDLDSQVWNFLVHTYLWPGNIRELQNVLQHSVLFCDDTITWNDLPSYLTTKSPQELPNSLHQIGHSLADPVTHPDASRPMPPTVSSPTQHDPGCNQDERRRLMALLESSAGNISEVGRRLGVARSTVYRRLNKHGLLNS